MFGWWPTWHHQVYPTAAVCPVWSNADRGWFLSTGDIFGVVITKGTRQGWLLGFSGNAWNSPLWQGIIRPPKSEVSWASTDEVTKMTLYFSSSPVLLASYSLPSPPLATPHFCPPLILFCCLVYHFALDCHIWSMSHVQSCLFHVIVNATLQGQLSVFYSKSKTKDHR